MKYSQIWAQQIEAPDDNFTNTIWAAAFSPDGSQVVVAVANRIIIYSSVRGQIMKALKGHQETVYCLAYSSDGKKFASGGADNMVIIWTNQGKPTTTYKHSKKVQCLSFNPLLQTLASISSQDFGVYNPNQKFKTRPLGGLKGYSLAWAPDGQILALGLTGVVHLKDKIGSQTLAQIKISQDPIFTLQFTPTKQDSGQNLLVIGSWNQTLSLYTIKEGKTVTHFGQVRNLGYDPLTMTFMPSGQFFVLGGSNRKVTLFTRQGVQLSTVGEHNNWIWSTATHPQKNAVLYGTQDGLIQMNRIKYQLVHGLDRERYAFRQNMTDIIIQHLTSQAKVKIKCKDYVTKISVYKQRIAVKLPDKIVIYSVGVDDPFDMKYKAYKKISKELTCSSLICLSQLFLIFHQKQVSLYTFTGQLQRQWTLDSQISYAKAIGGPPRREAVLVAQKNGSIQILLIDNQFPQTILKHQTPISICDMSANRTAIAVVDTNQNMYVYNRATQQVIFQEKGVTSVAFNTEFDQMISYTSDNNLFIRTKDFEPTQSSVNGVIMKLKGSKAYILDNQSVLAIDVPQSSTLYRLIQNNDLISAYRLASLGATEQDWKSLGIESLKKLEFNIARSAFTRIKDLKMISLVDLLREKQQSSGKKPSEALILGFVHAFDGKFKQAVTVWVKSQVKEERSTAIDMLIQMKMYENAEKVAKKIGQSLSYTNELAIKKAEWLLETGDWKKATEQLIDLQKYSRVIEIFAERKSLESIRDLCRRLNPSTHRNEIKQCAAIFKKHKHHNFAREALERLGQLKQLVQLHIQLQKWDDAFKVAKDHEYLMPLIYKPYAEYLVDQDKFQDAQIMFEKAARSDLSRQITINLARNSVDQKRFRDATYYYFMLASHAFKLIKNFNQPTDEFDLQCSQEYHYNIGMAQVYYAFSFVYEYVEDPFMTIGLGPLHKKSVLNAARYLVNIYGSHDSGKGGSYPGVSMVYVFVALGRIGFQFGAFKTARIAYDRLQTMKIPSQWQDQIDMETMRIRAKPYTDEETLLPICSRCGNTDSLINLNGDFCTACKHPLIRSFVSFQELGLVEFVVPNGMSPEKAIQLLKTTPPDRPKQKQKLDRKPKPAKKQNLWEQNVSENHQVLTLNEQQGLTGVDRGADFGDDPFSQVMFDHAQMQLTSEYYTPVAVNGQILESMIYQEVVIVDRRGQCETYPVRYFKNTLSNIPVQVDQLSGKICMQDEKQDNLQTGTWPLCGHIPKIDKKQQEENQMDDNQGNDEGDF